MTKEKAVQIQSPAFQHHLNYMYVIIFKLRVYVTYVELDTCTCNIHIITSYTKS